MITSRPHVALDGQYSMVDAAHYLGVDRKTIYRWRKCGYLKTKKHRHNNRPFILGRDILKIFDLCV